MGKGGQKHRYIQALIKELAEQHGIKATIEAVLTDGSGQVDVLLEREGTVAAAVEVSVTTPPEHEQANLRKCLAAGYPQIAVILAKSKATFSRYRAVLLDAIPESERRRIVFLTPEELPDYIGSLAPVPEASESIVKGYQVRVSHTPITPEEAKMRREALVKVIARSLRAQKS